MKKFKYRLPRFSVHLPVQFSVQDSVLTGHCTEIGKDGMTVDLNQPPALRTRGMVSVSHLDWTIELKARVAHVEATHAGLAFIYKSESERDVVAGFVASLAKSQHRTGPVLLS
jgi:hypothetical protein